MKKIAPLMLNIGLLISANCAFAAEVPDGFADLYKLESKQVKLKDTKGQYHVVDAQAAYDYIKVVDNEQIEKIAKILQANNVEQQYIGRITAALQEGYKNTAECDGFISDCIVLPEEFDFLYDYYTQTLFLYVNPSILVNKPNVMATQYAPSKKESWGLINYFNSYVGTTDSSSTEFSIYDQAILGLPEGNISSDFQYQSSDSDFELNELLYNYEFDNYRVTAGLARDRQAFNATDLLLSNSLNKEVAVSFGTSKNLLLNTKNETQRIFYFAPSSGVLTVYRDDRILLQRNVAAGQGYFTNDDLPRGRYDVVVQIEAGGQVTSREVQSIYNSGNNTLAVGGYDYLVSAGRFEETFERFGDQENLYAEYEGQFFGRGLAVYRPADWITLGGGLGVTETENSLILGAKVYLPYSSDLSFNTQVFEDGAYYADTYLKLGRFSASYSTLDSDEEQSLANYLYGAYSFDRASVATSFNLFDKATGFLSFTYTRQEETELFDGFEQSTLSASVNFSTIANSTMDISLDYDLKADDTPGREKAQIQFVWTVPLSDTISAQSQLYLNEDRLTQFTNKLRTNDLFKANDRLYASAEVGHNYYDDSLYTTTTDMSANASYRGRGYSASGYAFADDKGRYNVNAGFSSTQVVSNQGIGFSGRKADAYMVVNTDSRVLENTDRDEKGLLVLKSDGKLMDKRILYRDKELVPLRSYNNYNSLIDVESLDLFNTGASQKDFFTHPGTIVSLNSRISRVISFVSGFKDIFDNKLANVDCVGTGCYKRENLTPNVYKFSVMEGLNFTLKSDELVCLIPGVEESELFNFGNNYCLPNIDPLEQYITYVGENKITLTFVGGFDVEKNQKQLDEYIARLGIPESELIKKQVDNFVFVYFKNDNITLSQNQKDVLDQLNLIASNDAIEQINTQYALVKR